MAEEAPEWCLIESDPAVFTDLISGYGVKGVAATEVLELTAEHIKDSFYCKKKKRDIYSLSTYNDDILDVMKNRSEAYGLVFLFRWNKEALSTLEYNYEDPRDEDLFYAKQVVRNSCASQALLSVLMNCNEIELSENLSLLKNFSKGMDAESIGMLIGSTDDVYQAHNEYGSRGILKEVELGRENNNEKGGDAFHYLSYVPVNGKVYELDGLKDGAVVVGKTDNNEWFDVAVKRILEIIAKLGEHPSALSGENDVRYSLMAITEERGKVLERVELASYAVLNEISTKLKTIGAEADELHTKDNIPKFDSTSLPDEAPELNALKNAILSNIQAIKCANAEHENDQARDLENTTIKKWDFGPLALYAVKALAQNNELLAKLADSFTST